jgi:putative nucleotidyltransferase with HDIG domain
MRGGTFLTSRVARRVFAVVAATALLPATALTVLGVSYVTETLDAQAQRRLRRSAKAAGMGLIERIVLAEARLALAAASLGPGDGTQELEAALARLPRGEGDVFERVAVLDAAASPAAPLEALPRTSSPRLVVRETPQGPRFVLVRPAGDRWLAGMLEDGPLWERLVQGLPVYAELTVRDGGGRVLFTASGDPAPPPPDPREAAPGDDGRLAWSSGAGDMVGAHWPLLLDSLYGGGTWSIAVGEPVEELLVPILRFRRLLPHVAILAAGVALLAGMILVRRQLGPVRELRDATERLQAGDLDARAAVASNDELGDLAVAFNGMADRLGRQFRLITASADLDRAVLGALDARSIVEVVLRRLPELLEGAARAQLVVPDVRKRPRCHRLDHAGAVTSSPLPQGSLLLPLLEADPADVTADPERLARAAGAASPGTAFPLLVPVNSADRVEALLLLDLPAAPEEAQRDEVRQLVDQVSVALRNARLIDELDRFGWETLEALSRAIDAKSPWTAGHSQRVTDLGLALARRMGIEGAELDALRRSGLLHDIGKLGVPPEILDKPGRLTDEEFHAMREHPLIGARILAPVSAFNSALAVVRHHHERWDGKGYPDGLAGEEIPLSARIFAVADVFDALHSDRPYRPAWDRERVVAMIREEAGRQFDPEVVRVFLEMIGEQPPVATETLASAETT